MSETWQETVRGLELLADDICMKLDVLKAAITLIKAGRDVQEVLRLCQIEVYPYKCEDHQQESQ